MNSMPDFLNSLASKNEDEQKKAAMNLLNSMDSKQAGQIKSILGDEKKVREILSTPQAQQLMKKLKGGSNGQLK